MLHDLGMIVGEPLRFSHDPGDDQEQEPGKQGADIVAVDRDAERAIAGWVVPTQHDAHHRNHEHFCSRRHNVFGGVTVGQFHTIDDDMVQILGELGSTVLSVMKIIGFQNSAAVNETWIRAYSAPFPDRESCIGGIEFPLDVHYARFQQYVLEGLQTGNLDAVKAKPAMLASGDRDFAIDPQWSRADFLSLFPAAPVVPLPGVGHFCQEDAPDTLMRLVSML